MANLKLPKIRTHYWIVSRTGGGGGDALYVTIKAPVVKVEYSCLRYMTTAPPVPTDIWDLAITVYIEDNKRFVTRGMDQMYTSGRKAAQATKATNRISKMGMKIEPAKS